MNIVELRRGLGWSQGQLARTLGVTVTTVANWEHGRAAPSRGMSGQLGELALVGRITAWLRQRAELERAAGRVNVLCKATDLPLLAGFCALLGVESVANIFSGGGELVGRQDDDGCFGG